MSKASLKEREAVLVQYLAWLRAGPRCLRRSRIRECQQELAAVRAQV